MSVLGVMIDGSGSDGAAIEHRLSQGWAHFFERDRAFTGRRVPVRLRWKRFSETVLRTVLHGAGSWAPSLQLADKLRVFEAKCLKIMLNYADPDEADPVAVREFHIRLNVRLKHLKELFDWTSLADMHLNMHISWLGHVARLPAASPLHLSYTFIL